MISVEIHDLIVRNCPKHLLEYMAAINSQNTSGICFCLVSRVRGIAKGLMYGVAHVPKDQAVVGWDHRFRESEGVATGQTVQRGCMALSCRQSSIRSLVLSGVLYRIEGPVQCGGIFRLANFLFDSSIRRRTKKQLRRVQLRRRRSLVSALIIRGFCLREPC